MTTRETITIGGRFNGPEASANGGYACGMVAALVDGVAEVTLRRPPPLATPLEVRRDEGAVSVWDEEALVAEGRPIAYADPEMPTPPSWEEADRATRGYLGYERHEFPTCFTCGPQRDDGLAIFAGPAGNGMVAAPWMPDASLPGEGGMVAEPIVWAALDCPGAWADARDLTENPVVLGRMAAVVHQPIEIGHPYVAIGRLLSEEGRKSYAATALVDESGTTVATARQVWISLT